MPTPPVVVPLAELVALGTRYRARADFRVHLMEGERTTDVPAPDRPGSRRGCSPPHSAMGHSAHFGMGRPTHFLRERLYPWHLHRSTPKMTSMSTSTPPNNVGPVGRDSSLPARAIANDEIDANPGLAPARALAAALQNVLPEDVAAHLDEDEWIDLRDHFGDGGDMDSLAENLEREIQRSADDDERLVACHRISFRLLGDPAAAERIALSTSNHSDSSNADATHRDVVLRDSLIATTEAALAHRRRLDPAGNSEDEHHLHRIRLARDLQRHDPNERAILALRHLALIPTSRIATMMSVFEDDVRQITSRWLPSETIAPVSMLGSLDRWINTEREQSGVPLEDPFTHLDEPIISLAENQARQLLHLTP